MSDSSHPKLHNKFEMKSTCRGAPAHLDAADYPPVPCRPRPKRALEMEHAELHSAAASGDEAAVRRALQSAAAHVQEEEHGRSALMLAAAGGHEAVVTLLLSSGARLRRTQAQ